MGSNSTTNTYHCNRPITATRKVSWKKCKFGLLIDAQVEFAHKLITFIMSTTQLLGNR